MLTILFDGIAYGMLLFVLACGLAVTLGLMNFVNLAHGAFAMAGGYITAVLMNRYGVPFLATLPLAFIGPALLGLAARADALPAPLRPQPPRPGAVLHRPRLHGGGRGRLRDGLAAAAHPASALASGPRRGARHPGRALSQLHHRGLRRPRRRPAADPDEDAVRQPSARGGRRPARGARSRHQRQRDLRDDLRGRVSGWRAWAARSAPRSSASIRPSRSSS